MLFKKSFGFYSSLAALVALGITASGCKSHGGNSTPGSGSNGTLRVLLTDDPIPYRSISNVWVTISRVEAHHEGTGTGWVVLSNASQTVDALGFRNGVSAILSTSSLAAQTYNKVRLSISSIEVDMINGTKFFPVLNSNVISPGLDIQLATNINMVAGINNDVLVDLDLSQSLVALGDTSSTATITGFTFNPVFRAVDYSASGSIDGIVLSDNSTLNILSDDFSLGGVQVTILQGGHPVASGITDAFGFFKVVGLMPGLYDVRYERAYNVADGGYFDELISGVFVVQGLVLSEDATLEKEPAIWI